MPVVLGISAVELINDINEGRKLNKRNQELKKLRNLPQSKWTELSKQIQSKENSMHYGLSYSPKKIESEVSSLNYKIDHAKKMLAYYKSEPTNGSSFDHPYSYRISCEEQNLAYFIEVAEIIKEFMVEMPALRKKWFTE